MSKQSKRKRLKRKRAKKINANIRENRLVFNSKEEDIFILNVHEAKQFFLNFINQRDFEGVDLYSLLNDAAFQYLKDKKINFLNTKEAEKKTIRFFSAILHKQVA